MARGKRVRIQLDHKGIGQLLNSAPVQGDLHRRADRIAAAAGPGMEVTTWTGFDRVHATVRTATPEARRAEATTRDLTRALGAFAGYVPYTSKSGRVSLVTAKQAANYRRGW